MLSISIKTKEKTIFAYIAMTISFMGTCSLFQGTVGSLQWIFFYYGSLVFLLALSLYYISINKDFRVTKDRRFFVLLFCVPRILMLLYSCFIWFTSGTGLPYITRGISNTIFQCIAYFCGVCYACGEKDDILKVTLAAALTVFGMAYLLGFLQNGFAFLSALNPLSSAAYNYSKYTELHELAYIIGLYVLVSLITKKNTSLKKENVLFWLSVIVFFIAWKRIGIFAVALAYVYFVFFSRSKKKTKSFYVKVTGIAVAIMCMAYVSLIVSGVFVSLLKAVGIDLMGRDIIYGYFRKFASFSPGFLGRGVGFVTRQFDYTTRDDLYNMVSIRALHNDFFKMYIEIGFIGFLIWVYWWLIKKPQILQKRYGVKKAFVCMLLILYAFILYTTDNVESYTNFQLQLSAVITYIACFFTEKEKKKRTYLLQLG